MEKIDTTVKEEKERVEDVSKFGKDDVDQHRGNEQSHIQQIT